MNKDALRPVIRMYMKDRNGYRLYSQAEPAEILDRAYDLGIAIDEIPHLPARWQHQLFSGQVLGLESSNFIDFPQPFRALFYRMQPKSSCDWYLRPPEVQHTSPEWLHLSIHRSTTRRPSSRRCGVTTSGPSSSNAGSRRKKPPPSSAGER